MMKKKAVSELIGSVISVGALILAFFIIHNKLKSYHYHEILRDFQSIPLRSVALAVALTLASYYLMTFYDWLALAYIGRKTRHGKIWFLSFISYSFSNNMGHPLVTGAIRYRLYSAMELGAFEIAKVVAFCSLSLWLGFVFLFGLMFTASPLPLPPEFHFPLLPQRILGALFILLTLAYLFTVSWKKNELRIRKLTLAIPAPDLRFRQLLISSLDWICAASVLFVLLPSGHNIHYLSLVSYFLMAQILGMASQVPGGLGVFESVMLILLGNSVPGNQAVGVLLAFRIIYYFVPLGIATGLFALLEAIKQKKHLFAVFKIYDRLVGPLAPNIFAVVAFLGGMVLLFSGATPALSARMAVLEDFIPTPLIEVSHFFGSLVGIMLLFLAGGLSRRLRSSFFITIGLLAVGILVSLLKGFDYEEAIILGLMVLAMLPSYRQFYRKASLLDRPLSFNWILSIAAAVASTVWLGFFSFKHVQYSNELWWQFSLHGDASRFLRATVGIGVVIFIFSLARLFRHKTAQPVLAAGLGDIKDILPYAEHVTANLALLGDKSFFINEQRTAFIMYAVSGKKWIVMGDPVGKFEDIRELAWQFYEHCDRHGGKAIFYEVTTRHLELYLDMGLSLYKIGESARVDLSAFDLDSHANKRRRRTIRTVEADGCDFRIIPPEDIGDVLPELRTVSDAWLKEKHAREKGFSLGYFSEEYMNQFPIAIIERKGKILAFANLWTTDDKNELSVDLMRYLPGESENLMEYLFLKLFIWGGENGFRWFDLGMATLAGMEANRLAPLWHKLGSVIYEYGNNAFRLQGLRSFKDKFNPVWEPIYIAQKGSLSLPDTLLSLKALISSKNRKTTS